MVKQTLSNFRKQLKRNHVTAFLLHYHVHIDEEVECENVIILEKAEAKDVFRILNQYSISGQMHDGDFRGEFYEYDILECDDTCPTLELSWERKTWNTKWEEEDGIYTIDGTIMYKDPEFNINYNIGARIAYSIDENDVWTAYFYMDDQVFKKPHFQSTNERYGKNKIMDIAKKSYKKHFRSSIPLTEIYPGIL